MDYKIINSGSSGNAVRINDVMIDCGVSFKLMKDELYKCKYLLLTHIHVDHIKPATLRQIKKLFPKIQIIGNHEVAQIFGVDVIANHGFPVITRDYEFIPWEGVHDVVCTGYAWEFQGLKIIYATDTSSVENAPKWKYDYVFLESNYDENKVKNIKDSRKRFGYEILEGAYRHLSTQKCKEFYYLNRASRDSVLVELHKSLRFY